jgi:diguanylate cyclase (GGDEF)-like protein
LPTTTAAPAPAPPRADDGAIRVVLVGRTGLDASLRLDPQIELVRTRTLAEAIAELAAPLPDAPARLVVAVAEPLLREVGGARTERFARKVRELARRARLLVIGAVDLKVLPPAFDGLLAPDQSADQLRSAIRTESAEPAMHASPLPHRPQDAPLPSEAPKAPAAPRSPLATNAALGAPADDDATRPAASRETRETRDTGDATLVQLMVRGQDVQAAALALLRERTADPTLELIPPGTERKPSPGACAPLIWEDATLGTLCSTRQTADQLAPQARWLAAWLRLRDQQAQLREAAFTDPLTGAWNRRYFDRFLASALDKARDERRFITVLLFDIDDFKRYNDRYGHDAGDEILVQTVALLRSVIRPSDRVCRVGGDEFAVVFHDPEGPRHEGSKHPQSVFDLAHRFQQQVLSHRFPKLGDSAPGTLTISGGLATFPWDGATPTDLLTKADKLLMESKRLGKNAITFGPGAMRAATQG